MEVAVTHLVRDEGTIVIFEGVILDVDTNDTSVRFACDHRMAQAIANRLESGIPPIAVIEDWQILSVVKP